MRTPVPRLPDFTGQRYEKLTVLGLAEGRTRQGWRLWRCRCDCGRESVISANNWGKTKGCGCCKPPGSRGHGLPPGEGARRQVLRSYKLGAKRRGRNWGLTDDEFTKLISADCSYCGSVPGNVLRDFVYNGIDRIDNAVGYILDNVITCCGYCNRAKGVRSYQEFADWIARLVDHQSVAAKRGCQ